MFESDKIFKKFLNPFKFLTLGEVSKLKYLFDQTELLKTKYIIKIKGLALDKLSKCF